MEFPGTNSPPSVVASMLSRLFSRGPSDPRSSLKQLRECFRKDVLGDKKSATFSAFWRAVRLYSQDATISLTRAPASRPLTELQPAYDFVLSLLHDAPEALEAFRGNATAAIAEPVPRLHEAVNAFLERVTARPVRPALAHAPSPACVYVCMCLAVCAGRARVLRAGLGVGFPACDFVPVAFCGFPRSPWLWGPLFPCNCSYTMGQSVPAGSAYSAAVPAARYAVFAVCGSLDPVCVSV